MNSLDGLASKVLRSSCLPSSTVIISMYPYAQFLFLFFVLFCFVLFFIMGVGNLNSGLYASETNALPTMLSPQSDLYNGVKDSVPALALISQRLTDDIEKEHFYFYLFFQFAALVNEEDTTYPQMLPPGCFINTDAGALHSSMLGKFQKLTKPQFHTLQSGIV